MLSGKADEMLQQLGRGEQARPAGY
jgi:hypothetical protein